MGKEALGHVEINKDHANENRHGLFIPSLLQRRVSHHVLWKWGHCIETKRKASGMPWWGAVDMGGFYASSLELTHPMWLVEVHIWLSLVDPKSEAETKIRKTHSYWLSPGHFSQPLKGLLFGFLDYFLEILKGHFLQVWPLGSWLPELVTEDNRLVSWTSFYRE